MELILVADYNSFSLNTYEQTVAQRQKTTFLKATWLVNARYKNKIQLNPMSYTYYIQAHAYLKTYAQFLELGTA